MYKFLSPLIVHVPQDLNLALYALVTGNPHPPPPPPRGDVAHTWGFASA